MPGLFSPKGGATTTTTQRTEVPEYVKSAQTNLLNSGQSILSPFIQRQEFTQAPINPDQSAGYDLARVFGQNAFTGGGSQRDNQTVGGGFDASAYLRNNPDVAAAGVDPFTHYQEFGRAEGRAAPTQAAVNVGHGFDAAAYLRDNPDVAASGMGALEHFQRFGQSEGRAAPSIAPSSVQAALRTARERSSAKPDLLDFRQSNEWRAPGQAQQATTRDATAEGYDAERYNATGYTAKNSTAEQVNGAEINALLNPYIQDALNPTIANMRREKETTAARQGARAAAAGSFGGSRAAVQSAALDRSFGEQVAQTTGTMMAAGYDKATATALANAAARQQTALSNQGAENRASEFNAGATNVAAGANAAAGNRASEFGAQARNTADQFNAGQTNATRQFNVGQQNDRDDANAARGAAMLQAHNTNNLRSYEAQSATSNAYAQLEQAVRTGDLAAQQQAIATLLGTGEQQQKRADANIQTPLEYLKLLAGITPQNYGGTTTGTQPNTAPSPFQSLLGAGLSIGSRFI